MRQFKEEYENLLKQQKFGKGNRGDQQQSLGQNSFPSNAKMSYIGQGTSVMGQLQSNSDMSRKIESKYEVAIDKAQHYQSEYQDEPEFTNLLDHIMNYEFPEDDHKKSYGYKELREKCKIYEREDQTYLSKYIGKISYLNSGFLSDVLLRVGDRPSIHTEKLNRAKTLLRQLEDEWKENEHSYYDRLKTIAGIENQLNYDEFLRKIILEIDDLEMRRKFNYDL